MNLNEGKNELLYINQTLLLIYEAIEILTDWLFEIFKILSGHFIDTLYITWQVLLNYLECPIVCYFVTFTYYKLTMVLVKFLLTFQLV